MMKAQGEKIRSWDEVNGQDEKKALQDQSPSEAMEGPMRAYGQENYLKAAEELSEDDYNSIDGINPEEIVIPKKDRHSFDFSL